MCWELRPRPPRRGSGPLPQPRLRQRRPGPQQFLPVVVRQAPGPLLGRRGVRQQQMGDERRLRQVRQRGRQHGAPQLRHGRLQVLARERVREARHRRAARLARGRQDVEVDAEPVRRGPGHDEEVPHDVPARVLAALDEGPDADEVEHAAERHEEQRLGREEPRHGPQHGQEARAHGEERRELRDVQGRVRPEPEARRGHDASAGGRAPLQDHHRGHAGVPAAADEEQRRVGPRDEQEDAHVVDALPDVHEERVREVRVVEGGRQEAHQ
mmetsp:Transcript_20456/g.60984  ORF Transcript_20456/g.60984 Transcript_20456/m.60984 type:complete len:269 (+) Transcript_20456:142-948(+)